LPLAIGVGQSDRNHKFYRHRHQVAPPEREVLLVSLQEVNQEAW